MSFIYKSIFSPEFTSSAAALNPTVGQQRSVEDLQQQLQQLSGVAQITKDGLMQQSQQIDIISKLLSEVREFQIQQQRQQVADERWQHWQHWQRWQQSQQNQQCFKRKYVDVDGDVDGDVDSSSVEPSATSHASECSTEIVTVASTSTTTTTTTASKRLKANVVYHDFSINSASQAVDGAKISRISTILKHKPVDPSPTFSVCSVPDPSPTISVCSVPDSIPDTVSPITPIDNPIDNSIDTCLDNTKSSSFDVLEVCNRMNWSSLGAMNLRYDSDNPGPRPQILAILASIHQPLDLSTITTLTCGLEREKLRITINLINCELRRRIKEGKQQQSLYVIEGHDEKCCLSGPHLICNFGPYHEKKYYLDEKIIQSLVDI